MRTISPAAGERERLRRITRPSGRRISGPDLPPAVPERSRLAYEQTPDPQAFAVLRLELRHMELQP